MKKRNAEFLILHHLSNFTLMKIFPSAIAIIALSTLSLQAQNKPLPSAPEPKPTAASERLEGLKKKTDSDKRSIVTNVAFRNVGPTIMSGRVVDIDVNPADPTQFYVAYASGGVWFTGNNGTSFTPVFDGQQAINIGDIAVDWKAATPVIWVGTGESNSSRSSYAGTGIYKSTDGGKTWINKGLPESHHIGKVIIDKNDPNTVYVAVIGHLYSPNKDRGLYKSKDGGETWNQVLFVNENTGIIDAFQDPNDPKTMYAISWHRERRAWNFVEGGTTSGIYKSVDYGATWTSITGAGSNFPSSEYTGRIGLSIAPQNSNILYAVVDNQQINPDAAKGKSDELKPADFRKMTRDEFLRLPQEKVKAYLTDNRFPEKYSVKYVFDKIQKGTLQPVALADFVSDANNDIFNRPIIGAEVYRSDDAGKSWKKTNKSSIDLMFFTYGYYFGKIYVSPFDVNEVYILGVSMQMSKDGGKTFAPIDGDNQHGDHHALWMNPSRRGHLINGNDGGMNLSWDNGQSWMKCNTPAVGQFYAINVDMATPYNVYGGLQDNGVWTGPSTYKASTEWHGEGQYPYKRLLGGDGMQVMIDPRDNNTVYTGYQFGHFTEWIKQQVICTASVRRWNSEISPCVSTGRLRSGFPFTILTSFILLLSISIVPWIREKRSEKFPEI
ncbi:MAG: hypothetical protein Fur0041_11850 [Bacteroidia bacterium]